MSNKVLSNKSRDHPVVSSRRDVYSRWAAQRYKEDPEDVAEKGMDIGDYDFIDRHLVHCPMVNWVE